MESATYWQQLFTQALRVTQLWQAEQARSEGVLTAAAEFQSRLRLLSRTGPSVSTPCILAELPDAVALLRGKHLRGLENIMAALRESIAVFAALHKELAGLHAGARRKHACASTDAPPTLAVVGAGRGTLEQPVLIPPPWQCLNWVSELDGIFSRELLLKTALVGGLTHDAEHTQQALHLWRLQPNLGRASLERLHALVSSLSLGVAGE
mmetsp:Transcript_20117/g.41042  ORF Transcript_20117/g.41042 Transcript_20117/m.41042 type:complete len:209 (-) Transcript_20117:88-714(-)|eukprot:CAMPEP_0119058226 /NCGR_PEP_ID=MMETSP1178-20130426/2594_1 /TAXON_ID=33656 /ORGANISM="unid sp, Strain CCMP2000" /LENGTH=208 /DNA_ID=CAMNT_0007039135 /DNA_START=35 /DNA_END=661 /DNA_ORIENTATION=-